MQWQIQNFPKGGRSFGRRTDIPYLIVGQFRKQKKRPQLRKKAHMKKNPQICYLAKTPQPVLWI